MGSNMSKSPDGAPLQGDEKYMARKDPNSMRYMLKWKKKYGVKGQLKTEEWKEVVVKLEASVAGKTRDKEKMEDKQKELDCARHWLREADKRKKDIQAAKDKKANKSKEAGTPITMFVRPEDNETQLCSRRQQAARVADMLQSKTEETPAVQRLSLTSPRVSLSLYPDLTSLPPPPPEPPTYDFRDRSELKPPLRYRAEGTETYPMIQVANPNPGERGPEHLYVFRPWTLEEARRAVEGLTPIDEDVEKWIEDMRDLILSYRLNGYEAGQAAQTSVGKHWARVRGDYTGRDGQNEVFPAPVDALSSSYDRAWTALEGRIVTVLVLLKN